MNTDKLQKVIKEALKEEFAAQGHTMTGKIVNDMEFVVKEEETMITISGYMYPYGNILAAGVSAGNIPFSGRTGAGGTSKYIQALQRYAQTRMNITDEKKSLSIAFAIAHAQREQGMPTYRANAFNSNGSYSYSKTGDRLQWIELALKKREPELMSAIREMEFNSLSVNIDVNLKKWQVELNKN